MSNVIEFAKNMALTSEERALREAELQDGDGNWTETAKQLVLDLNAQKLGFKDEQAMLVRLGCLDDEYCDYSPTEYFVLFQEYTPKLTEIAMKMKEEKTK